MNKTKFENDIQKIVKLSKNFKIFGMGEATHGQDLITQFRTKVFKNLVKYAGYTVFVLEEQYSCCQLINIYIQTGIGNPEQILQKISWPWQSTSMLGLIKWMRKYNIENGNKLRFYGVDIKFNCRDYCREDDEIMDFVGEKIKNQIKLDDNSNQEDINKAINYRDKGMFEVFMKIYNPDKKYFLYAHQGHLSKEKYYEGDVKNAKWFGNYIYEAFGEDYYTVGNSFVNGTILGDNMDSPYNELDTTTVITPIYDEFSEGLHEAIKNNNFGYKYVIEGGAVISKIDPIKYLHKNRIGKRFDAIMVIKNEMELDLIKDVKYDVILFKKMLHFRQSIGNFFDRITKEMVTTNLCQDIFEFLQNITKYINENSLGYSFVLESFYVDIHILEDILYKKFIREVSEDKFTMDTIKNISLVLTKISDIEYNKGYRLHC